MGTSTPKTVGSLFTDGSVDRIFLWDPALAGQAQDKLALRLLEGRRSAPYGLASRHHRIPERIAGSPHGLPARPGSLSTGRTRKSIPSDR